MEALFLKVFNMSITASYVILAVLFVRLLLKRAPKRYAYLLWAVVLFRLLCPVSFSSLFSLFQNKPFDMTMAQSSGGGALQYIPADIGYMNTPRITVGISTMNTLISETLPAATPYASVNPMQIWIWLGAMLWSMGMVVLLVYHLITYVSLKQRMATAVRLEEQVYESDKIRSPFILGFLKPRIYIPFGLREQELGYILQHERVHLKRRDHLIKPLSLLLLTLHWFNPLVWLAYRLMCQDMEMSCDERVLSETDGSIAHDYSLSLLSFAANRRFLSISPLAFGETGVKARVKNVLRFKKPAKWVVAVSAVLCVVVIVACAANPIENVGAVGNRLNSGVDQASGQEIDGTGDGGIYGNYVFEKTVYMNPLSSFLALEGHFKEYYTLTPNFLIITSENGRQEKIPLTYEKTPLDEESFKNDFLMADLFSLDIASYQERYQLTKEETSSWYRIYQMDEALWLARVRRGDGANIQQSDYIWSIYQIAAFDAEIPVKVSLYGNQEDVEAFLALSDESQLDYDGDTCYNITPEFIKYSSDYQIFKYDTSCASFLQYQGEIYPLGIWFGGLGVTSMALEDLNGDGEQELYFTYSWGSGIHRSQAAYFDPVSKQVHSLDYSYFDGELMVAVNDRGQLSLYAAEISNLKNFVSFDMEGTGLISEIIYQNDEIRLSQVPQ